LAQGAKPEGSIERQEYDRLRASLSGGDPLEGRYLLAVICEKALVPHFWHRIVYCATRHTRID